MDDGGIYSAIAAYEAQIEKMEEKITKIEDALNAVWTAYDGLAAQETALNAIPFNTAPADWQGQNYEDYCSAFESVLLAGQTAYMNQVMELTETLENAKTACQDLIKEYRERIQALRKQLQLLRAKKKR